jgi:hypothetical protein
MHIYIYILRTTHNGHITAVTLRTFKKWKNYVFLFKYNPDLLELFYLAFYIGKFYEICIFSLYPE